MDFLSYGDVFINEEEYFIYLFQADSVLYCAKIIGGEPKKRIQSLLDKPSEVRGIPSDSTVFCFTILTTDRFKDDFAHLRNTQGNITTPPRKFVVVCPLNIEDKRQLSEKILESKSSLPIALVKYVESLKA